MIPSASAVLRLMTSWNLVGCSMGWLVARLSTRQNSIYEVGDPSVQLGECGPIGHQASVFGH